MSMALSERPPAEAVPQPIVITLFGAFSVTINGEAVTRFRSTKARALLAYLLLARPQPLLRTTLSELLWPDYTPESAQTNLRQTLTNVRDSLGPFVLIHADRRHVQLRVDPTLWCDVFQFDALLDACQQHDHPTLAHCPLCRPRLQEAVALAQGVLLENFPETDSAPFSVWLQAQRARVAGRLAEAQTALATKKAPLGNLPPPLTSLVGRAEELADLARKLQHTVYRCVSLVGPGGIGKTRLACALGAQLQDHFPAGVWLVELGALATAAESAEQVQDHLAIAIAVTLALPLRGTTRPTEQVANHLADKAALLILDSFEHVSAGAAWLPDLLATARRLRLLITTRHRLPLQSQLVQQVQGLAAPLADLGGLLPISQLVTRYASVQLFVARAESAQARLALDPPTLTTVSQLCRFVEGSPWAIELAVSLLDQQSPAAILAAIQTNYRALTTPLLDVPARQRSAEAVFLTAWRLLTAVEAQVLARCGVFQHGFTLAAAENIALATPAILESLVQKSLLTHTSTERYAMHDLARQFASEQLAQNAAEAERVHAAHAAYFTALLATWQLDDAIEQLFRTAVTRDWENVQAAWAWAVAAGEVTLLQQGVYGLAEFYEIIGLYTEADRVFGAAIARIRLLLAADTMQASDAAAKRAAAQTLLGYLLWRQIRFLTAALGQLEQAQRLAEELLAWARQLGDRTLEASGYYELSVVALFQGDYERQQELLLRALALMQQQGNRNEQVTCLAMLGIHSKIQHAYPTAQAYFEAALALAQQLGSNRLTIHVLSNFGTLQWDAGRFTEAIACFQQVLPQAQRLALKDREVFAMACLGALAYTLGDYANARTYFEQARQGFHELGDQVMEAQTLNMLGALFAELGDMTVAGDYGRRALASPVAHLYTVQREGLVTQGHLHRAAGDWPAAREAYQAALGLSQETNLVTEWVPVQAYLAALELAQGEPLAALAAVEPVLAHFADSPFTPAQRPQELLLIAYEILVANHDPRAPEVLAQAWRLVQQHTEQINDPQLRHTYLTNVPVNRDLAQLVQR